MTTALYASEPAVAGGTSSVPEQFAEEYTELEREVIARELVQRGEALDPAPEGKTIDSVRVIRLNVWDERDPIPDWVNSFHVTSLEAVIRRELLLSPGETYDLQRIEESARNLREMRQLSLVLILPVKVEGTDRVRVVIITKDIWSLRLNWFFEATDEGLVNLVLNPSEWNFLGTHWLMGAQFTLSPDTYAWGGKLAHQRLLGGRVSLALNARAILNRQTGEPEGSLGGVLLQKPLYARAVEWAWRSGAAWNYETTRRFVGLKQVVFDARPEADNQTPCNDPAFCLPYEYRTRRWAGEASLTRSFGNQNKLDISFGIEADVRDYRTPRGSYDDGALRDFEGTAMPISDTRWSPVLGLDSYASKFMRTYDLETLGLQEDYRLGHRVSLRLYPASSRVGSTRDMIGSFAGVSYTWQLDDGLVRAVAASTIEYELSNRHDATFYAHVRAATPHLGFGRFHYDVLLATRYKNYLNRRFALGGDGRLRGYPGDALLGTNQVASTLEFRSRAIDFLSVQWGGAVFYDAGTASDGWSPFDLKQGAGVGIRALIPQFDRAVFRLDWAYPFDAQLDAPYGTTYLTFNQAFTMPALGAPSALSDFEALF